MQKAQKNQQGIAAIEFGLLITLVLIMCAAIASFGVLMWAQQKVSHIAGDSARVALLRSIEGNENPGKAACSYARDMAENDWLLGVALQDSALKEKFCRYGYGDEGEGEGVSCPEGISGKCVKLTMTVTVSGLPLVNMLQTLGKVISKNTDGWMPNELSATSVVKITNVVKT